MLAQSWKFEVNECSISLINPTACTRARAPFTSGHAYRPPKIFTQFAQKGWQSTGLELRIPMICLKLRGSGPEKNWGFPPKTETTSGDHPTPPSLIRLIYIEGSLISSRSLVLLPNLVTSHTPPPRISGGRRAREDQKLFASVAACFTAKACPPHAPTPVTLRWTRSFSRC